MSGPSERRLTGIWAGLLALLSGPFTIAVINGCLFLIWGSDLSDITRHLEEEWGILLVNAVLVSFPFGCLALERVEAIKPWVTAAILTALVWALPLADVLVRRGAGGANIGLGFLLLLSPVIITAVALAVASGVRPGR
jgi:hypothetical protein